ncbi:MAG: DUF2961 domain-containing protein [Pirellulaceae bacterium]|nr:DUF2961 domain-containing protein [Pirellulaceae bacterium]
MSRPVMTLFVSLCVNVLSPEITTAQDAPAPGWPALHRIDLLPQYSSAVRVGCVSSYDRTGGNDDGFSGKYSFLRREDGGLVIADLQGPGVIYRIWTPTPTDDWVEFYFDGESTPRIGAKFRDIFGGQHPPFVAPLVGSGAGGYYCCVPLPYHASFKVVVRAERVQFYQINYAQYPPDMPVVSWTAVPTPEAVEHQQRAQQLFGLAGQDLSGWSAPPDGACTTHTQSISLAPGTTATLFASPTGGRVVGLRLSPATALAGKARDLTLRITCDDQPVPTVLCPAGDFFGYAWGQPATRSLLVGTAEEVSYCYFPMPYDQSIRIELMSERTRGEPVTLAAEVVTAALPRQADEGRFCAVWRRENLTTAGVPFTFVELAGQGHLVGCILQAQGTQPGETLFFEGDDQTTIDGELVVHGTGSEDFFNGGWYDVPDRWERTMSFPLSGCLAYHKPLGRTGGYRLLLGDKYTFRHSIRQTIEHAPTGNEQLTDYVGTTFLYLRDTPSTLHAWPLPEARAVTDPTRIVFKPAWAVPIRAFTFRGATLTKMDEDFAGRRVSFLRMQSGATDWFGQPFISLDCPLPAAGSYEVAIEAVRGPEQGIVQLFRDERPAGPQVDLYAAQRAPTEQLIPLGVLDVPEGPNTLTLKIVGKNAAATGYGLDLGTIQWRMGKGEW